ncbi:hypothetical protein [Amycolatopsis jiangsuensis]|uniref:Uncharacterized protein n=1 Tax=Amycolatopsis jiangsuensis TaxID=1181879 RepID=A0A840ITI1_9PSEU|nr:hypothetical protein [Amycolatopsis jiangsuensis]MBB4685103.1 hypothetical protein [Amycolatopsis jiangsuensis]
MSESDLLCRMFQAWREDIDSVPIPQFTVPTVPPQLTRAEVDAVRDGAHVSNPTRRSAGPR